MLDAATATGPNWPQIKTDYEAGTIPVRQIAALAGVSDTAIHKRAKSEGWDAGLRKPDEPALPGLQTGAQTKAQTSPAEVDRIVAAVERACATAAHPEPEDGFKWEPENDAVVLTHRPAIAVYVNPWNQIVIRKQAADYEDDDPCIWLDRRDVQALIKRLEALSHGA